MPENDLNSLIMNAVIGFQEFISDYNPQRNFNIINGWVTLITSDLRNQRSMWKKSQKGSSVIFLLEEEDWRGNGKNEREIGKDWESDELCEEWGRRMDYEIFMGRRRLIWWKPCVPLLLLIFD